MGQGTPATGVTHVTVDCDVAVSKSLATPDVFSIKHTTSGLIYKVKDAGITFTIITIKGIWNDKPLSHYGLLCEGNTFVTPSGEYKLCLAHRVAKNLNLIFADSETVLFTCFRKALNGAEKSLVSRMKIGRIVKVASTYAAILQQEMALTFKIKISNPSKETNCMAFVARVIKKLEFLDSNINVEVFKKNLIADGWTSDFADMNCKFLNVLLGVEKVGDEKYAVSVLNAFITEDAVAALEVMMRYLSTS